MPTVAVWITQALNGLWINKQKMPLSVVYGSWAWGVIIKYQDWLYVTVHNMCYNVKSGLLKTVTTETGFLTVTPCNVTCKYDCFRGAWWLNFHGRIFIYFSPQSRSVPLENRNISCYFQNSSPESSIPQPSHYTDWANLAAKFVSYYVLSNSVITSRKGLNILCRYNRVMVNSEKLIGTKKVWYRRGVVYTDVVITGFDSNLLLLLLLLLTQFAT
jgi:hypothetical protein